MDLISIIIPMYNAEKYIGKLLYCIKSQTYSNLEIIIVDDESTDDSLNIAKSLAKQDDRIKVISALHAGVGNARNIGIDNANGKYITFLDADDYIEFDMYEKIIKKIKETNSTVLRCNYVKEDKNGKEIKCSNDLLDLANKKITNNDVRTKLLPYVFEDKIHTYMPLVIAKADLIKNKMKFRTDINMMEDLIFFLELFLNAENIFFYDYKCYHYVVNSFSSTKSRAKFVDNCYDVVRVIHILEKLLKDNNIDDSIFPQVYYIYSTIFIKYLLRIFEKKDKYTITYEQMVKIIKETEIIEIINKSDFSKCKNEKIKTVIKYLKNEQYEKLYEYASANNL